MKSVLVILYLLFVPEGALHLPKAHDGIASAIPLESYKLDKLLTHAMLRTIVIHITAPCITVPQ